jgi:hypothetical protein
MMVFQKRSLVQGRVPSLYSIYSYELHSYAGSYGCVPDKCHETSIKLRTSLAFQVEFEDGTEYNDGTLLHEIGSRFC